MTEYRSGIGYDVHAFGGDSPLMVGCVEILGAPGVLAHSDGDVVAHAICDALLGAVALGDIGGMFPPTDDKWSEASGVALLNAVARRLAEEGFEVGNVDAAVSLERPQLAPYIQKMRTGISDALRISVDNVSVKATTQEGLGFVGRVEGISCIAIATVRLKSK